VTQRFCTFISQRITIILGFLLKCSVRFTLLNSVLSSVEYPIDLLCPFQCHSLLLARAPAFTLYPAIVGHAFLRFFLSPTVSPVFIAELGPLFLYMQHQAFHGGVFPPFDPESKFLKDLCLFLIGFTVPTFTIYDRAQEPSTPNGSVI